MGARRVPTSTPTASQEAAATTAGVRSIALTARQLPGFHATDPADESTDHDAFTLCKRQSWASEGLRVAQYERQWLSAKHVLLDDIVLGYDSPAGARGAYNEFRGSAATCPAFTDSGTHVSFPSGDATSPIAGECAGLSQPALVAATH